MISELEYLLPEFSPVNHIRCFLHVINLVARTLVRQFDAPKKIVGGANPDDEAIIELAGDMEFEDRTTCERLLEESGNNAAEDDDDVDGWADEMAALSQAERDVLTESTRPVKMVLVKVSNVTADNQLALTLLDPGPKACFQGH